VTETLLKRPISLADLIEALQQDAENGLMEKPERRITKYEAMEYRFHSSEYEVVGEGCYLHLMSTNADGEHYDGDDHHEADSSKARFDAEE